MLSVQLQATQIIDVCQYCVGRHSWLVSGLHAKKFHSFFVLQQCGAGGPDTGTALERRSRKVHCNCHRHYCQFCLHPGHIFVNDIVVCKSVAPGRGMAQLCLNSCAIKKQEWNYSLSHT